MAVGKNHNAHAQLYFFGATCKKGKTSESFEKRTIGRNNECRGPAIRVGGLNLPWNDDAIGAPNRIVAEVLCLMRGFHQCLAACGSAGHRKKNAEFHITGFS